MDSSTNHSDELKSIAESLPGDVEGWKIAEEDHFYTPDNLHEYINGGAELYISYGFKKVFSRVYSREGNPDILLDIFDMGGSSNAFGIFSHTRETVEADFGQGSQYSGGLLLFWKDRYYISLLASPETKEAKKAVEELARSIESAIPREGELPKLLKRLPGKGLNEASIRYFHHYIWLNSHYFVANDNILFIEENTDAVLARYSDGQDSSILLLVQYACDEDAIRARNSFVENYLPERSESAVAMMLDGSWTGYRIEKNILAVVFASRNESNVRRLLDGFAATQ